MKARILLRTKIIIYDFTVSVQTRIFILYKDEGRREAILRYKYFYDLKFLGDRDVVIIYKYLNSSNSGILSKEEFTKIYDAVILHWEPQYANIPWYHSAWMPMQNVCQMAHTIISLKYFEYFFCK